MTVPVTYRSKMSRLYSENFVKDLVPLAQARLESAQGIELPPPLAIAKEQSHAIMEWARSMEPLYEVTVDSADAIVVTGAALIEAWKDSVPEGAARALDLSIRSQMTIIQNPRVAVRRIR